MGELYAETSSFLPPSLLHRQLFFISTWLDPAVRFDEAGTLRRRGLGIFDLENPVHFGPGLIDSTKLLRSLASAIRFEKSRT
ncbi:hypothetical protein SAY86_005950 [Trapa natans]|uniref:Uncharacterized protein n=1 Tax=Trapa natans TaxID=22666 RepID=A0AAN7L2U7_TRANT|nr:hypothetical protein SAY86_005950 [Trapa natans]